MPPPTEGPAAHELLRLALVRELRQAAVQLAVDLRDAADGALATAERRALSAAAGRLLQEADLFAPRAAQALVRPAPRGRADGPQLEWPRLMDDAALEQQIVAAELARAVRETDEGIGLTWEGRLRALGASDRESAALGIDGICAAALDALTPLAADPHVRRGLRPLLLRRLPPLLAGALRAADTQLASQGVVPAARPANVPRTLPAQARPRSPGDHLPPTSTSSNPVPRTRSADPAPRPELEGVAAAGTLVAVERLGEVLRGSAVSSAQAPLGALLPSEADGPGFAQAAGVAPFSAAARALVFEAARERLARAGATPQQRERVDTVAALFDYALDDQRVPASAAPLLWELQAPILALALLDDRYLADGPRSLSRLVEHVAALVAAFPQETASGGRLQPRLRAVVNGVRAAADTLQARSSVLAVQLNRQFDEAASRVTRIADGVTQARGAVEAGAPGGRGRRDWRRRPDASRERAVTERLARLIDDRLEAAQVGDAVKSFVGDVWLRHLRTTALRDGQDSLPHRVALQVLDDLLWSADEASLVDDRHALAERIPPLIRLLSDGIGAVGGHRSTFAGFFDELFLIHRRRLGTASSAGAAGEAPAAAATAEGTVSARARHPASVDLHALVRGVDLDDHPHDAERRRISPALVPAALQKGDWLELVDRAGKVSQAKIGWLDSRRRALVLVRWPDGRPLSLRMSVMVERFADGRAFLLTPRPSPRDSLLALD